MRILITDADSLASFALASALAEAGHEVGQAEGCELVVLHLLSDLPHVLFLDLSDGSNGYDVLRWLRDEAVACPTRVIVTSDYGAESDELREFAHVVAVLERPLVLDQVMCRLATVEREMGLAA